MVNLDGFAYGRGGFVDKIKLLRLLPFVLYVGLSVLYLFAIPPGESPDEPSHLQCIEQVALYNRLPIIEPKPYGDVWWARERIVSGLVCAHMPLYYIIAGYTERWLNVVADAPLHYEFPPNDPLWRTGASLAMFEHNRDRAFLHRDEPVTLVGLRIESMLFGLATMVSAYCVTKRFTTRDFAPVLAMTFVAGWPQFLFMSRAITNDGLAVAFAACTIAVLIAWDGPKRYVLASVCASLAVLSKLTMVFTIGAVGAGWIIETWLSRDKARYVKVAVICALIFTALASLLVLHPVLREHLAWSRQTMSNRNVAAWTFEYWWKVLRATMQSGWARFGWMNVTTPDLPALLWWLMLAGFSVLGLWHSLRMLEPKARFNTWIVCVWLLGTGAIYLRINLDRFQPQFRYAFSSIPVLVALAAAGIEAALRGNKRLEAVTVGLAGAVLTMANLWLIWGFVVPAYF